MESGITKTVTAFVHPLRADRVLTSPGEAARFVSLIGFEQNANALGSSKYSILINSYLLLIEKYGGHCTLFYVNPKGTLKTILFSSAPSC
jgi:hypothetical protein